MARKLPPYVLRERSRHGKRVFYFRIGRGPRVRLPPPGSGSFDAAYRKALLAHGPAPTAVLHTDSLEWLIERYRETKAYQDLSQATRRQRDNIFQAVKARSGGARYRAITEADIEGGKQARADTPSQARNFLDAMRGLFRWAKRSRLVTVDPTSGVENPRRAKTQGFAPWTEDDLVAYERRWPEGTRERVWLHVLLYTGLRRGDAVRLGRQHVRDGVATIKTEKSRYTVEVNVTILPPLERTLEIGPTGDLAFIVGESRRPLKKETFGNMFRAACNAAGLKGKSAHGVRKIGAQRAAEAGATVAELEALFGWTGGTMASYYTRNADRKRLARAAAEKIRNTLTPHLSHETPHLKKGEG